MRELTFIEVINNIREGETYKSTDANCALQSIKKEYLNLVFDCCPVEDGLHINPSQKFILQEEYYFEQAFTALQEGKKIQSVKDDQCYFYSLGNKLYHGLDISCTMNGKKSNLSVPIDSIPYELMLDKWYIL